MMVLLSKREYDELVKRATAAELIAEEKAEAMKRDIKVRLQNELANLQTGYRPVTLGMLAEKLREILNHY